MGGGFWKFLKERVHFITAIETLWMLLLSDVTDRFHHELADVIWTSAVFYICWICFTKRKLNKAIMLYPVLFTIRHSFLPHPSPHVSHCMSLQRVNCPKLKDFKRVTQIILVFEDQFYKPTARCTRTHTHTHAHTRTHTHTHTHKRAHTHTPQGDGHWVLPKAILSISLTFTRFSGVKANLHTHTHTHTHDPFPTVFSLNSSSVSLRNQLNVDQAQKDQSIWFPRSVHISKTALWVAPHKHVC